MGDHPPIPGSMERTVADCRVSLLHLVGRQPTGDYWVRATSAHRRLLILIPLSLAQHPHLSLAEVEKGPEPSQRIEAKLFLHLELAPLQEPASLFCLVNELVLRYAGD